MLIFGKKNENFSNLKATFRRSEPPRTKTGKTWDKNSQFGAGAPEITEKRSKIVPVTP